MDRRTFTKTLAALFAAPAVLAEEAASAASVPPVFGRQLPSYRGDVIGHYGMTRMNMTTTFDLEQTFVLGQVELDPLDLKDPIIETDFSFFPDSDRKIERTVYFQGTKKQWVVLTEKNEASSVYNRCSQSEMIDDSKHRQYYAASEARFFDPDTHERVPANRLEKDKHYTIHVDIGEDFDELACRIILTNFKAINIQDFTEDEVDFPLEKC